MPSRGSLREGGRGSRGGGPRRQGGSQQGWGRGSPLHRRPVAFSPVTRGTSGLQDTRERGAAASATTCAGAVRAATGNSSKCPLESKTFQGIPRESKKACRVRYTQRSLPHRQRPAQEAARGPALPPDCFSAASGTDNSFSRKPAHPHLPRDLPWKQPACPFLLSSCSLSRSPSAPPLPGHWPPLSATLVLERGEEETCPGLRGHQPTAALLSATQASSVPPSSPQPAPQLCHHGRSTGPAQVHGLPSSHCGLLCPAHRSGPSGVPRGHQCSRIVGCRRRAALELWGMDRGPGTCLATLLGYALGQVAT